MSSLGKLPPIVIHVPPDSDAATCYQALNHKTHGIPMFKSLSSLALIGLVTFGTAAAAQDAAPAEPQVGDAYIREVMDSWTLRCLKVAEGEEPCQAYQILTVDGTNPTAEVKVYPAPEGADVAAIMSVTVPLGTLLTEGLAIAIDSETEGTAYEFQICTAKGCIARIGIANEMLDSMKAGEKAVLRMVNGNADAASAEILLDMPLAGFTAALDQSTPPQN